MEVLTWDFWLRLLDKGALVAMVSMFGFGYLMARPTVEKFIVKPLNERIDALEKANSQKDEQQRDLMKQQAAALETQSQVINRLLEQFRKDKGD